VALPSSHQRALLRSKARFPSRCATGAFALDIPISVIFMTDGIDDFSCQDHSGGIHGQNFHHAFECQASMKIHKFLCGGPDFDKKPTDSEIAI
jgi:hypothetical protein